MSNKPQNISEYLERMNSDAEEIHSQLMDSPLSLTATEEPRLYGILIKIKSLLAEAKEVWPSQQS